MPESSPRSGRLKRHNGEVTPDDRSNRRPAAPTGRRAELLAAAVDVVADGGLRGLTHRAVDARAGLPEGTCSAYLRTRSALLVALADHVGGALEARVTALASDLQGAIGDPVAVSDAVTELTLGWIREPALVRAQAELSLEAARQPELMEVFERWRDGLLRTVRELGERSGRPQPAQEAVVLVAAIEGFLVTAVRLPEEHREGFLRGAIPVLVHAMRGPESR